MKLINIYLPPTYLILLDELVEEEFYNNRLLGLGRPQTIVTQLELYVDAVKKKCRRLGIEVVVHNPTQKTTTSLVLLKELFSIEEALRRKNVCSKVERRRTSGGTKSFFLPQTAR